LKKRHGDPSSDTATWCKLVPEIKDCGPTTDAVSGCNQRETSASRWL
jgi:hypothetical protein